MLHHDKPLRFRCTRCGCCCYGGADDFVAVTRDGAEAIRRHLGLSKTWFRARYLQRIWEGQWGLRFRSNGACVLLDDRGQCRAYGLRPVQCRTYPFWPETVYDETSWRREAGRCEGINHGNTIPLAEVEAKLRAMAEAERSD